MLLLMDLQFIWAMFQYGKRGILLATSFYKNFVIRKEGQNGVDFEEVGISQQRKGVLFQSFINFIIW